MKSRLLQYFLRGLYLLVLFHSGCNSRPEREIIPSWTSEILGPLVKTSIEGKDLSMLSNLSGYTYFKLGNMGYNQDFPVMVPDTIFPELSFNVNIDPRIIHLKMDGGNLYFELKNEMGIDIKKGAVITIKQMDEILFSETLENDLGPYSGYYRSKDLNLSGKTITPDLTVQITNIGTHGSSELLEIYDKKLEIYIKYANTEFNEIALHPGEFHLSDTSAFNLNGRVVTTESISGDLITYIKNHFPFQIDLQFYFMDADHIRKDSLFDYNLSIPPSSAAEPETSISQRYESTKSENINRAKFLNSIIRLYSTEEIIINKENYIDLQVVGDLKFRVNN